MKLRNVFGLLLSAVVVFAAGCGGGSSSSTPAGATVSGVASKGPILGGTVNVFEVISSATVNPRTGLPRLGTTALATTTTSATDGSYALALPAAFTRGSILVQVTGGSYKDEATGTTTQLASQFGATGLRAAFGNISGAVKRGQAITVCPTPLTEMAYLNAATLTDGQVAASNLKVAQAFGLTAKGVDIVSTTPLDATAVFPAGATVPQEAYTLALATLSQYQKNLSNNQTLGFNDAQLAGQIQGSGLSGSTATTLATASNIFASGPNNPNPILNTPQFNPNAPATLVVAPATATTVDTHTTVTITATVKKQDATAVPDGTVVSFATNFGTLSAASAFTSGGVASVTLGSTAIGAGSVTVKSGAQSATTPLITFTLFVDPNAPTKVAVTATPGSTTAGNPVAISATVTKSSGAPVADGTVVQFAVTTGTGTLSAATAPTVAGVASVNLNSTAAGTVVVTATAAGTTVSGTATASFVAQPTSAVVTVSLTGTLPTGSLIGATTANIAYPASKLRAPTSAAAGQALTASFFSPNTAINPVSTAILWQNGISTTGAVETLTFPIIAGQVPTAADFSVAAGSNVKDLNSANLSAITVVITNVVIQ